MFSLPGFHRYVWTTTTTKVFKNDAKQLSMWIRKKKEKKIGLASYWQIYISTHINYISLVMQYHVCKKLQCLLDPSFVLWYRTCRSSNGSLPVNRINEKAERAGAAQISRNFCLNSSCLLFTRLWHGDDPQYSWKNKEEAKKKKKKKLIGRIDGIVWCRHSFIHLFRSQEHLRRTGALALILAGPSLSASHPQYYQSRTDALRLSLPNE